MTILDDKAHIVFLAVKEDFIHGCKANIVNICRSALQAFIDFRQTLFVVEYISKQ